ncbi:MAG TPA: glycosyltransferase [Pyrinomonadaceae bacterium]|jgi:glycosyltransferase involved in cell wall biosynthesis
MKTILVVSYYFPPCNSVATARSKSFAENFRKHGLSPVVVTRHWRGEEKTWTDYHRTSEEPQRVTEGDGYRLVQLPYRARLFRLFESAARVPLGSKLFTLLMLLGGRFDPEVNAFEIFYEYLREYLRANRVDYLLVTAPPLNLVRLGYLLKREFGVPLVVDFRDLWSKEILRTPELRPRADAKENLYEFHLRRWLKAADLVVSVSAPLVEELERINPGGRTAVVMNGYDAASLAEFDDLKGWRNEKFTVSTVGTLYETQDLSVLLEGLKLFLADKGADEVRLNFVGTAVVEEVRELLSERLPPACTRITHRVERREAQAEMFKSDVLFYAGWKGYRGVVSTKLFEYLSSGRNILIAPSDHDIIEEVLRKTGAGRTADTPEEFAAILNGWFAEWKRAGRLSYHGKEEEIGVYSREHQAELLAREILSL